MLGVTRSLGDFYHQQYGVTWEPEIVVHDLAEMLGAAPFGMMCIASDGVWDHWTFEEAMDQLRSVSIVFLKKHALYNLLCIPAGRSLGCVAYNRRIIRLCRISLRPHATR